ncbi:MAG: HD domain-containing phosphohydrolase [Veillonellales bacterium]
MKKNVLIRVAEAVQASSMHGWLVIDRNYRIVFVNDAFCKLWEMPKRDLIGQSLLKAIFDGRKQDDDGIYHGPLIETMDTGREFPAMEACIGNSRMHSYIWHLVSTFLLRDEEGQPEYAAGIYVGIDKFKVIEKQLDTMNMDIIRAFCKAIGIRDAYTKQHSEHVATLMVDLAEYMKLPAQAVTTAYLAGIVHDVGKIGVPEKILNKPGRLTGDEYEFVKRHSARGADILTDIPGFDNIADIVRHHHERFDGLGYPAGLKGDAIPLFSRMMSVCDAYDAMTSARCYREPLTLAQALAEVVRCTGSQFDPAVSEQFIQFIHSIRASGSH